MSSLTGKAVNAGRDGAFVGQVTRDASFVFSRCAPDERRVENEAVLRCVPFGLERPV